MAKGKRKDAAGVAREKLADAQAKLQAAQERRRRIGAEGEQEVEQTRKRAADRLAKATLEVEQRAAKVARAEGKLLALQAKQRSEAPASPPAIEVTESETASPVAAADRLEELAEEAPSSPIATLDGAAEAIPDGGGALGPNERRLLAALGERFDEAGATFSAWLAATALSKRTFLRARKTLVEQGLVTHNGTGIGARYALTGPGRSAAAPPG